MAVAVAAVSIGCAVAAVALPSPAGANQIYVSDLALAVAFPVLAAVVLTKRPGNRVGWLLMSGAWLGPYLLASAYAVRDLPGRDLATWLSMWGFVPYWYLWTLLPVLFPDGRPASRRWRAYATVVVAVLSAGTLARMFAPAVSDASDDLANPLGITGAVWLNYVVAVVAFSSFLVFGPVGLVALVLRVRRARGPERAQLQWLMLGCLAFLASTATQVLLPPVAGDVVVTAGVLALTTAVGVATVRHGLYDVDVVLNRALVYGVLTGFVLLAYVAAVAAVGELSAGRRAAYLLVALAALGAASARGLVQRLVDRMLFGHRRDPAAVLSTVGGRLDVATGPVDALAHLTAALCEALKLPYAAVEPADPRLSTVEHGRAVAGAERLPATAQGEHLGDLVVGHRHAGERFGPDERAALTDVARRAGGLLRAAGLVHDLQRSREAIVAGREEERRRLRRDLHDGVGPQLAALALQMDALVARLSGEPAERAERIRDQLRATVGDVRRVVDDLRPPALDELGLAGALREHAAGLPGVTVRAAGLGELPAAVEVAAYRIATEAVTNAVRHARATGVEVRLDRAGGWLTVEVGDDGRGIDPAAPPGVGLASMRDRAGEVGGRFEIAVPDGGGTTVRARLPVEDP